MSNAKIQNHVKRVLARYPEYTAAQIRKFLATKELNYSLLQIKAALKGLRNEQAPDTTSKPSRSATSKTERKRTAKRDSGDKQPRAKPVRSSSGDGKGTPVIKFGKDAHRWLTTFQPNTFTMKVRGETYLFTSVEQALRYFTTREAELKAKILTSTDPQKARYFGSTKAGATQIADYANKMPKLLLRILLAHYQQNTTLRKMLVETGPASLVFDAPWDSVLGTGKDGNGDNILGMTIEAVRNSF